LYALVHFSKVQPNPQTFPNMAPQANLLGICGPIASIGFFTAVHSKAAARLRERGSIGGKHIMNSYRRLVFGVVGVLCFFARTAGAADFYWDTVSGANNGLTAGDGSWCLFCGGIGLRWSTSPSGTTTGFWENGNSRDDTAHFVASGTSLVQVIGSEVGGTEIVVKTMIFDGTGYTIGGNGALFLVNTPTIITNADATISNPMKGIEGMTKQGSAILTFSGGMLYSGATTINAGTLILDNNNTTTPRLVNTSAVNVNAGGSLLFAETGQASTNRINDGANVSLGAGASPGAGGKLNTGGLTEGTAPTVPAPTGPMGAGGAVGAVTLTMNANSVIDFTSASSGSVLVFQNFSLASGTAITIDHWTGSAGSNGVDKLLFASNPGYTLTDLANVQFTDDTGTNFATGAQLIDFNGYFELVPVPVPGPPPDSVVSRKGHGSPPTNRDIPLPLTGCPGIECRTGGATGDHQLVFTFPSPVSVNGGSPPQADVTSGTGDVGTGGVPNGGVVSGNGTSVITVPLTNVANEQEIVVTLFDVDDGTNPVGDVSVLVGVLAGDTNEDRGVDVGDTNQTRSRSGQVTNDTNKRSDVNLDGRINVGDVNFVRSRSGDNIGPCP
jgi:autotransporter-associated beta strand protein